MLHSTANNVFQTGLAERRGTYVQNDQKSSLAQDSLANRRGRTAIGIGAPLRQAADTA
ncbi:hypothetical protein SXCC_03738 [Gluconacetobacter sp. SXCC-1]|nr:hypothetical protein SXCC_03738 [Gluconacetobacter sp. SXCC-1]